MRKPDEYVGPRNNPFSLRWWVFRRPWLQVCIHEFHAPDPEGLHDHPWWNITIVLRGKLLEELPGRQRILRPGMAVFRRATDPHRLTPIGKPRTLFITGRERRSWGYWRGGVWIDHRKQ